MSRNTLPYSWTACVHSTSRKTLLCTVNWHTGLGQPFHAYLLCSQNINAFPQENVRSFICALILNKHSCKQIDFILQILPKAAAHMLSTAWPSPYTNGHFLYVQNIVGTHHLNISPMMTGFLIYLLQQHRSLL